MARTFIEYQWGFENLGRCCEEDRTRDEGNE